MSTFKQIAVNRVSIQSILNICTLPFPPYICIFIKYHLFKNTK